MKTLSERHRQFAIRAAYWALLGAIAGATASAVSLLHYNYRHSWAAVENPLLHYVRLFDHYIPPPVWMYFVPGALFGIALSLAIRREGLATWWQIGAFIAASAFASYIPPQIGITWFYGSGGFWLLSASLHGALNAAAAAAIFPFARRLGPALALAAAGPITYWLTDATYWSLVAPLLFHVGLYPFHEYGFSLVTMIIAMFYGSVWHGVQAAILSTALPAGRDSAAMEIWRFVLTLPRVLHWVGLGAIAVAVSLTLAWLYFNL